VQGGAEIVPHPGPGVDLAFAHARVRFGVMPAPPAGPRRRRLEIMPSAGLRPEPAGRPQPWPF
jgi:hypothetical protein